MDEKPQPPTTSGSATTPPPPNPTYIGTSNIIDRSHMQAVVNVPAPPLPNPPGQQSTDDRYQEASSAFSEVKVLICGVASATSYLLTIYITKNVWITVAVSAILALAAIFFAVSSYGRDGKISPLSVVGLSAATITLVYIGNILLALAFLHSLASSGYGI